MAATVVRRESVAEPEKVWAVVSDVDRWPRILSSLSAFEWIEGMGLAEGARWRETRPILGLTVSYDVTVTDVQPAIGFTLSEKFDDAVISVEYRLKPSSVGTRLEATVTADSSGVPLNKRILGVINGGGPRIAREVAERDLADFQAALRP